ncbi:MAG: serine hydrolase [Acidobacteriota bacterium]
MKRIGTAVLTQLVLVSVALAILLTSVSAQDVAAKLDAYATAAAQQKLFTGSVLIAQKGTVLLSKGYGMANIELDVANTPQTKFRLGSITKQFTAASILLLQEQGKLSVQDPVCKFVTECPPAWQALTIHHLLSHTGGVPNFTSFPDYTKTMMMPSPAEVTLGRFKDKPLTFTPGEKWNYSNSGYVLLGVIIEKVSGLNYGEFVRTRIFEPLKMSNSGYDRFDLITKNRASGYANDRGIWVNAPYLDMTIPHAAGSLYSTVEDLYLWDQSLYTERLLNAKSLAHMFTMVLNDYGYGWGVGTQFQRKHISHGGGINGFATFISRYPEEKVTVIVLSNFQQANAGKIARDLGAAVFGEPYEIPRARVVAKVDPKIYDAYLGKYELAPPATMTVTRNGEKLFAQLTGQPVFEIFPESETKFFLRVVEAQLTFVRNEEGKVTQLILHQGGDRIFRKIE